MTKSKPLGTLSHLTIQTGHVTTGRYSDIDPVVVGALKLWLRTAKPFKLPGLPLWSKEAAIPGKPGYYAVMTEKGDGLLVSICIDDDIEDCIVLTFAVAPDDAAGENVWCRVCDSQVQPPPAPWCAVKLQEGIAHMHSPFDILWMGDFQRLVAWAWMEHVAEVSAMA